MAERPTIDAILSDALAHKLAAAAEARKQADRAVLDVALMLRQPACRRQLHLEGANAGVATVSWSSTAAMWHVVHSCDGQVVSDVNVMGPQALATELTRVVGVMGGYAVVVLED